MNIRLEIMKVVDDFVAIHQEEIQKFKCLQDSSEKSAFDYLPVWNSNIPTEQNPLNHPLVTELSEKVFVILFGENKEDITFNLQGHISNLDGKKWSEVNEIEENSIWKTYSYKSAMDYVKTIVFIDMIEAAILKIEIQYRLINIGKSKLTDIFDSSYCKNCDKSVAIFFNLETKCFESNKYFKACPKVRNIFEFKLKLPSKRLVIVNDLSEVFIVNREDEYSCTINSIRGKVLESEEYLKHNIGYMSLSSGCVNVVKSRKQKIVGLDLYCEHFYNDDETLKDDFELVGEIFLDYWAIFMLDYEHYKKLCEDKGIPLSKLSPVYVDVEGDSLTAVYDLEEYVLKARY